MPEIKLQYRYLCNLVLSMHTKPSTCTLNVRCITISLTLCFFFHCYYHQLSLCAIDSPSFLKKARQSLYP